MLLTANIDDSIAQELIDMLCEDGRYNELKAENNLPAGVVTRQQFARWMFFHPIRERFRQRRQQKAADAAARAVASVDNLIK